MIQFIDFIEKYSFENYLGKNDFWKKGGGKVKFYKGQKKPDLSVTPEDAKSYIVRLVHDGKHLLTRMNTKTHISKHSESLKHPKED